MLMRHRVNVSVSYVEFMNFTLCQIKAKQLNNNDLLRITFSQRRGAYYRRNAQRKRTSLWNVESEMS